MHIGFLNNEMLPNILKRIFYLIFVVKCIANFLVFIVNSEKSPVRYIHAGKGSKKNEYNAKRNEKTTTKNKQVVVEKR